MIDLLWQDLEEEINRDWWLRRAFVACENNPVSKKKYQKYLNSNDWKVKRQKAIDEQKKCQRCGATDNLVVHHVKYTKNHTKKEKLEVLCKQCHYSHHFEASR